MSQESEADHGPLLAELRERLINIENKINALMAASPAERSKSWPIAPEILNIPNPRLAQYAREIFHLLRPMDVTGKRLVRKGRDFDGGYVMLDHALGNAVAYSLGISDDASWDLAIADLDSVVYQYDHTIERFPAEHRNIRSHKIGICDRPSAAPEMKTIGELIATNGHGHRTDLIMNMDIEGAEWNVFERLGDKELSRFSQIIVELHGLVYIDYTNRLRQYLDVLRKITATHQVIHVHANNCGAIAVVAGTFLPDTLEVTLVRRADHSFAECTKVFPTDLDMPCDHAKPDFFLGALGQL